MRIGIDLGGTKISGIPMNAEGRERTRARVDTPRRRDYAGMLAAIRAPVARLADGLPRASPGDGMSDITARCDAVPNLWGRSTLPDTVATTLRRHRHGADARFRWPEEARP